MERGAWRDTVHKVAESDTTEVTEHARMSSWGLPAVYWASVTHRHLSALSPVKDSSLWSCPRWAARLLGSSDLSLLRSRVSLPSKSNFDPLGLLMFLQKTCSMEESSISLLPGFYLLLRRVVCITSSYHPTRIWLGMHLQGISVCFCTEDSMIPVNAYPPIKFWVSTMMWQRICSRWQKLKIKSLTPLCLGCTCMCADTHVDEHAP